MVSNCFVKKNTNLCGEGVQLEVNEQNVIGVVQCTLSPIDTPRDSESYHQQQQQKNNACVWHAKYIEIVEQQIGGCLFVPKIVYERQGL